MTQRPSRARLLRCLALALALVAVTLPPTVRAVDFGIWLSPLEIREGSTATLTLNVFLPEGAAGVPLTVFVNTNDVGSTASRGTDYRLFEWRPATPSEPAGWYVNTSSFQFVLPDGYASGAFSFRMEVEQDSTNGRRRAVIFSARFRSTGSFQGRWYSPNAVTIVPAGFCGRTPQVRDAIVAALSAIDDCLEVTTSTLAGLDDEGLDLNGQGIETLKADDFDGLVNLRQLEMSFNPINFLPAGIFDDLVKLERLDLTTNELTTLPSGLFDHLTRLERLSLQGNDLTTLPSGLFDNLTGLEQLYLSNNALTALPAGLFDDLTRIERLDLGDNQLTTLPTGIFADLTRLTWLRLSSNALDTVPETAFDGLAGLEELWLDDNQISSLPDFASSTALTILELGSNRLASVPANAFRELTALTTLHLDRNRIATLHRDTFSGLGRLTELWLSYNELNALPADVFDPLTALDTLELHSNDLTALPAGAFDSLTGLTGLWLHDNRIGNPPAGLFHPLTSLTTLSLRDNRIERLPVDAFLGLDNLDYLWLEGNPGAPFNGLLLEVENTTGGDIAITEAPGGDSFTLTVGSGGAQGIRLTIPRTAGTIRKVTLATLATAPVGAEGDAIRRELRAAMDTDPPAMVRAASSSQEIFWLDVQGSAAGPLGAPVTVCLPHESSSYDADDVPGVFRHVGGEWSLFGGRREDSEGLVCGATSQFSAFVVFLRAPLQLPDVNWDYTIDASDALILYYAFSLRSTVGTGR